jgi:multidrug efflux system outer membrane protein
MTMAILHTHILTLFLLTATTGCAVGPNYERPSVLLPLEWRAKKAPPAAPTPPAQATDLRQWWRAFGDPTLDRLIDAALAENLDLKTAAARVREARAQRVITASGLYPSIGASGSYERTRLSENSQVGAFLPADKAEADLHQASFDASWELDVFGGIRRGVEAADAEIAAAEEDERDLRVTLLAEAARNYVEVRGLERRLAIARENIEDQRASLGLTQDRLRTGIASELDVMQAKSLLASTEAQVPALESQREQRIHALSVLLAREPNALQAELAGDALIPGDSDVDALAVRIPAGLPSDLLRRRPDIRRAEREVAAATARVGVATAELFPKFSLTGLVGLESVSAGDFFSGGSRYFTAGPTISWRLFEGGRIRANIAVADARDEQALHQYEKVVLIGLRDVEDALVAYEKERRRRNALMEAVEADRRSVVLARDLYVNGLGTYLAVLDAERAQYAAEDTLAQGDEALAVDLIATYKALGGGWESTDAAVASR